MFLRWSSMPRGWPSSRGENDPHDQCACACSNQCCVDSHWTSCAFTWWSPRSYSNPHYTQSSSNFLVRVFNSNKIACFYWLPHLYDHARLAWDKIAGCPLWWNRRGSLNHAYMLTHEAVHPFITIAQTPSQIMAPFSCRSKSVFWHY